MNAIVPVRSRSIETSLLAAPQRTFLSTDSSCSDDEKKNSAAAAVNLVLYLLPTSVTECASSASESSSIQTKLIAASGGTNGGSNEVVATYDVSTNSFLGISSPDNILATLSSDDADKYAFGPTKATADLEASKVGWLFFSLQTQ